MVEDDLGSDYLDSVLVGGRESRDIVIVEYDPRWSKRFEEERSRIAAALGGRAMLIQHFGSTAVAGLAAKPIIDILVVVENANDEAAYASHLEAAGYAVRVREPGHRMFRSLARDVHVHLWSAGDHEIERHLHFRDRLRESEADRKTYESAKRELATRQWQDTNDYAEAKSTVIQEIMERLPERDSE